MRTNRGIKITTNCVANNHAATNERIIEFMDQNNNIGGLISFRSFEGTLRIDVYRCDPGVNVTGPAKEPEHGT